MKNFLRRHSTKICIGVGLIILAALGAKFFFPAATAAAMMAVANFFSGAGTWISGVFSSVGGWFGRGPKVDIDVSVHTPDVAPDVAAAAAAA